MKRIIIFISLLEWCVNLHGQSFFNILPDTGGNNMQGVCRAIIPLDSSFAIIGHRFDTTGLGSNTKPWLGEFSYDGVLTFLSPLIDSSYDKPFYPDQVLWAHKRGDLYYSYGPRHLGGSYYTPYLFEFNIHTGEILRSKLIPNQKYPDTSNWMSGILFNGNTIQLISTVYLQDSVKMYITEVDTLFNKINFIEIENIAAEQFPKYFRQEPDSSFIILGDAYMSDHQDDLYSKNFYIKADRSGHIIEGKISPSDIPISINLTYARTITQGKDKNWVIAGHYILDEPDSCFQCQVVMPYIYSVSSNFDSLLWETRFYDIPFLTGPYYDVYSLTTVEDGYIGSASFTNYGLDKFPDSGVLFKAALNGDSLWMKHYIPMDWDEYRVVSASLIDIKTSPFGSIIAAGQISDRDLQIIRPWILHMDKDGCLVPGCNTVATKDNTAIIKKELFKIFPNPVSDQLYLLSNTTSYDPITIQMISIDGTVIKKRKFNPQEGFQYTLQVEDLPAGSYYLIFTNPKNGYSESHSFIRL